jgi:hypothetical protein
MPDITTRWPTQRTHLANAIRWEVIMEHEILGGFTLKIIHQLLVPRRSEGCHNKRLGLSTGKQH